MHDGINIYSGTPGLGGALTNPTCLSKKKRSIVQDYPVWWNNRTWPDAESAYQAHKRSCSSFEEAQDLLTDIITAKLQQHRRLTRAITKRGGTAWLEKCRHFTGARTIPFKRWEGTGRESAFIRCLIAAYEKAAPQD